MSMKIIKITESDISRLIKRIISEQDDLEPDASDFGGPQFEGSKLIDKDFREPTFSTIIIVNGFVIDKYKLNRFK